MHLLTRPSVPGCQQGFINNRSANTVILFAASLNILPPVYISSKTDPTFALRREIHLWCIIKLVALGNLLKCFDL